MASGEWLRFLDGTGNIGDAVNNARANYLHATDDLSDAEFIEEAMAEGRRCAADGEARELASMTAFGNELMADACYLTLHPRAVQSPRRWEYLDRRAAGDLAPITRLARQQRKRHRR